MIDKIDYSGYKAFLMHQKIMKISNRNQNKWVRRYKKYLKEDYSFYITCSSEVYKRKVIILTIQNKWLERKIKRYEKIKENKNGR